MSIEKKYNDIVKEYCAKKKKWGQFGNMFPEVYEWVIKKTWFLDDNPTISQRLWHILEDNYDKVHCQKEDCNNFVKWHQGSYRKFCSTVCSCKSESSIEKRNYTCKKKYGVESFAKIKENKAINEKSVLTNMQRYGASNYLGSEEFKSKNKQVLIEKYGEPHYAKTKEFKEKIKKTLQEKYGVTHNMKIPEVYKKRQQTWHKKYGGHPLSNGVIRKKIESTNMEKYGCRNPTSNSDITDKIKITAWNKHNRNNPAQYILSDQSFSLLEDADWLREKRELGWSFPTIAKYLDVDVTTVVSRFKKFNIPYVSFNIEVSVGQQELFEYVKSLRVDAIINDRKIIEPLEIDILLPDQKMGIEYCGLYWHNELFVDKNYHKQKLDNMRLKGYALLTIYEDEWYNNKDIVKSIIASKLGKIDKKIYARKCTVREVYDREEVAAFLDNNHIQGKINYSYAIGLYFNDELVSVMTFIIEREKATLNRFCVEKYNSVIGGFSKLLRNFEKLKGNEITEIKTFADCRWSNGSVYRNTEFVEDGLILPDYEYIMSNKRYHKFLFRKDKMKQKLKEFHSEATEHENALLNGLHRIYDCGKLRFKKEIK